MPRTIFNLALGLVLTGLLLAGQAIDSTAVFAGEQIHKIAVHVDESDPKRINMALNNVQNIKKYYDSVGEAVEI